MKEFARTLADEQSRAYEDLKALAAQKKFTLPSEPRPEQKAQIGQLEALTGAAFDEAYLAATTASRAGALALFDEAAGAWGDPDVKTLGRQAASDAEAAPGARRGSWPGPRRSARALIRLRPARRRQLVDQPPQLFDVGGLREVAVEARREAALAVARLPEARERDQQRPVVAGLRAERPREREAVHVSRQLQIAQDHLGAPARERARAPAGRRRPRRPRGPRARSSRRRLSAASWLSSTTRTRRGSGDGRRRAASRAASLVGLAPARVHERQR